MAAKRKDSRGIVLNQGESQNASGRYRYRYVDNDGMPHDVYSWRLRQNDPFPEGKKPDISLREKEAEIQKMLQNGVKVWGANTTLNKVIEEFLELNKNSWSRSTYSRYEGMFNTHIKNTIGKKKLLKINYDMVFSFYRSLVEDAKHPLLPASLKNIHLVIHSALQMAVKKDILVKNPADGALTEIKRITQSNRKKHALEEGEQQQLLEYIKVHYARYYNIFYLLAQTGCRINELLALTWKDIDFEGEKIYIRRSLSYVKIDGECQFQLNPPKTAAGYREIPMFGNVKNILIEMSEAVPDTKVVQFRYKDMKELAGDVKVDNLSDFIFKNPKGKLYLASTLDDTLARIVGHFNKDTGHNIECTPHTFRHSFCCWLCENVEGENATSDILYIQSIMGHSDAKTTLNIYSELRRENREGRHEALKTKAIGR